VGETAAPSPKDGKADPDKQTHLEQVCLEWAGNNKFELVGIVKGHGELQHSVILFCLTAHTHRPFDPDLQRLWLDLPTSGEDGGQQCLTVSQQL
jgi:hypothetical protein